MKKQTSKNVAWGRVLHRKYQSPVTVMTDGILGGQTGGGGAGGREDGPEHHLGGGTGPRPSASHSVLAIPQGRDGARLNGGPHVCPCQNPQHLSTAEGALQMGSRLWTLRWQR